MEKEIENKKITVICKNISVSFIGKYRRDLEKPNWHYYEASGGDIFHFKKFEMVAVIEGEDFVVKSEKIERK